MSFITIPKATVERHNLKGSGYTVVESYQSRTGETFKTYFTIWSKDLPALGSEVKVSGKYSDSINNYEDREGVARTNISRSVNDPKVEILSAPAVDAFAPVDEDTPF